MTKAEDVVDHVAWLCTAKSVHQALKTCELLRLVAANRAHRCIFDSSEASSIR